MGRKTTGALRNGNTSLTPKEQIKNAEGLWAALLQGSALNMVEEVAQATSMQTR